MIGTGVVYELSHNMDYVKEGAEVFETIINHVGPQRPFSGFEMRLRSAPGSTLTVYGIEGDELRDYIEEGMTPREVYQETVSDNMVS